jgi:hypothetical protein
MTFPGCMLMLSEAIAGAGGFLVGRPISFATLAGAVSVIAYFYWI